MSLLFGFVFTLLGSTPSPCGTEPQGIVYCSEEILSSIANAHIFKDFKDFVDMPLVNDPEEIVKDFQSLPQPTNVEDIQAFLDRNFVEVESELIPWTPPDMPDVPPFLEVLASERVQDFAVSVHGIWLELAREQISDVRERPERTSSLVMPHPLVTAGGRFREMYYWDSYWIVLGLLESGMHDTARNMVRNGLHLISKYGFIPNGGRVYYLNRSQPPFVTLMVDAVYEATKDESFLREALPLLDAEHAWFDNYRSVSVRAPASSGREHRLSRYDVPASTPRPESYDKDLEETVDMSPEQAATFYKDICSACESGWDFTSRWMRDSLDLKTTRTSEVVPVCLNSVLLRVEKTLAKLHALVGDEELSLKYASRASDRSVAMNEVMWSPSQSQWLDVNIADGDVVQLEQVSAANFYPLWAELAPPAPFDVGDVVTAFGKSGLVQPSGVATTLVDNGEQWDFPNGWAPLQHLIIDGLRKTRTASGAALAEDLALRWLDSNLRAYERYGAMFEKYDVTRPGEPGGGGEYEGQVGFGWTNGVALWLLPRYGADWNP